MQLENAKVINHEQVAPKEYLLTLYSPEIVAKAEAGQFVTLQITEQIQPLLRRPISIHDVDQEKGLLLLYYHVVGTGTDLLSQFAINQDISVLGPLGTGFDLDIHNSKVCLVGGGIGQAPLRCLAKELAKRGNEVLVIIGARDKNGLQLVNYYQEQGMTLRLCTEDGSLGEKGFVTALMGDLADQGIERIYTCGPLPMMGAVKTMAQEQGIACQVSLEEKMACGVGVCLGCTCKSADPDAPYPKVCTHGPVFWAQEVNIHD